MLISLGNKTVFSFQFFTVHTNSLKTFCVLPTLPDTPWSYLNLTKLKIRIKNSRKIFFKNTCVLVSWTSSAISISHHQIG